MVTSLPLHTSYLPSTYLLHLSGAGGRCVAWVRLSRGPGSTGVALYLLPDTIGVCAALGAQVYACRPLGAERAVPAFCLHLPSLPSLVLSKLSLLSLSLLLRLASDVNESGRPPGDGGGELHFIRSVCLGDIPGCPCCDSIWCVLVNCAPSVCRVLR